MKKYMGFNQVHYHAIIAIKKKIGNFFSSNNLY